MTYLILRLEYYPSNPGVDGGGVQVYLVQSRSNKQMFAMKVLNKQRVIQKEQVRGGAWRRYIVDPTRYSVVCVRPTLRMESHRAQCERN